MGTHIISSYFSAQQNADTSNPKRKLGNQVRPQLNNNIVGVVLECNCCACSH